MAAVTAAVITMAATAYSAYSAKSAAGKAYKNQKRNVSQARAEAENAISKRQNTPGARATPFLYDMALQVYGKAFGNHGFNLPIGQLYESMNLANLQQRSQYDRQMDWQGENPMAQTGFSPEAAEDRQIGYDVRQSAFNRMRQDKNAGAADYNPNSASGMPIYNYDQAIAQTPGDPRAAAMGIYS